MTIATKKPPYKETVGAQYFCFNKPVVGSNDWTGTFEEDVEKTETVSSVTVKENVDTTPIYSSGIVYDSVNQASTVEITDEVIAFVPQTLCRMRGDLMDTAGLILSGGNRDREYFAYGKVVRKSGGAVRYDWYPKCKLSENTDDIKTSEDTFKAQNDKLTIVAYPFNSAGDIKSSVETGVNFPAKLTEDAFFSKPILTATDLAEVIPAA